MGEFHNKKFPNETQSYRSKRDELLKAEINLRTLYKEVSDLRQTLPLEVKLKEDYVFRDSSNSEVRFSELFKGGKDSLILYHWMYGKDWDKSCPMCSSFISSLNGNAFHITQRTNLAIVGEASMEKLKSWANRQEWKDLQGVIYSCGESTFGADYSAQYDSPWGNEHPICYTFKKVGNDIFLYWSSEQQFVDFKGEQPRHLDMVWGMWNALDLIPEGRGKDWYPEPR